MNDKTLKIFESKGIEVVSLEIAQGFYGSPGSRTRDEADSWVRAKQLANDALSVSKRDSREEETLSIAKAANSIAADALSFTKRSRRADRIMAITAIMMAAIAAREDIIWLISLVINLFKNH